MQLILDLNIVKLVHFDGNIRVQGLLENGFVAIGAAPLNLLREASEVDNPSLIVGVDVKELDPRAEVVHELAQSPRRDAPVVYCLVLVKLGMRRGFRLEDQRMRCRDA